MVRRIGVQLLTKNLELVNENNIIERIDDNNKAKGAKF